VMMAPRCARYDERGCYAEIARCQRCAAPRALLLRRFASAAIASAEALLRCWRFCRPRYCHFTTAAMPAAAFSVAAAAASLMPGWRCRLRRRHRCHALRAAATPCRRAPPMPPMMPRQRYARPLIFEPPKITDAAICQDIFAAMIAEAMLPRHAERRQRFRRYGFELNSACR